MVGDVRGHHKAHHYASVHGEREKGAQATADAAEQRGNIQSSTQIKLENLSIHSIGLYMETTGVRPKITF